MHDLDPESIRACYARQAERTAPLRRYLYRKASLARRRKILDVGCGAGDITAGISSMVRGDVTGLDSDERLVRLASSAHPGVRFITGDAQSLPFEDGSFDMVVCHFLLMWAGNQLKVVREMARVLDSGGVMVACAEPDYGGRVEHPENPGFTGTLDASLERQGADIRVGRKLGRLFRDAGIPCEMGVSAEVLLGDRLLREYQDQREILLKDLSLVAGPDKAERLLLSETELARGGKMLMIPIFWAIGFRP